VTLTLIEKDSDRVAGVVNTIFDAVKAVKGDIDKAIDELLGLSSDDSSSTTSPDVKTTVFVTLVNVAINALIGLIGNLLGNWFESDVFNSQMVMVAVPSATSLFPGGSANSEDETVTFTSDHFKGKYVLTYDWRVL
jgi:hypothetical protein